MVPSYPAVLFAYRQHCRFVQAEATTLPAMNSKTVKKTKKLTESLFLKCLPKYIHTELSCVCAEVGILLTKKTRLTSEMSTSQASEPGSFCEECENIWNCDKCCKSSCNNCKGVSVCDGCNKQYCNYSTCREVHTSSCPQQELRSSANATVTPNRRASAPGTLVRTGSRGRNPAPLASAPASEEEQQAQQPAPTEGLVPTDGMVSTEGSATPTTQGSAPLASAPASEEEQQAQQPAPTEGLVPTDGMVSTEGTVAVEAEPKDAAKTTAEAMSAEETTVRGWLAEKGLEELTSTFVNKDYCDVELMKEIGLDDDDLDFLEINDATQRAILQEVQTAASKKPVAVMAGPKAARSKPIICCDWCNKSFYEECENIWNCDKCCKSSYNNCKGVSVCDGCNKQYCNYSTCREVHTSSCPQQELRSSANATVTPNRRASAPGTLIRAGSRGRNPAPLASAPASEEEQQAQQPAPTEGLVPTDGMVSTEGTATPTTTQESAPLASAPASEEEQQAQQPAPTEGLVPTGGMVSTEGTATPTTTQESAPLASAPASEEEQQAQQPAPTEGLVPTDGMVSTEGTVAVEAEPKDAAKTTAEAMSAEETTVRGWLAEKGLEELTSTFVNKDYCDVELMKEIGLDDDDLDFLEINDATQRAILQEVQTAASKKPVAVMAGPQGTQAANRASAVIGAMHHSMRQREHIWNCDTCCTVSLQ